MYSRCVLALSQPFWNMLKESRKKQTKWEWLIYGWSEYPFCGCPCYLRNTCHAKQYLKYDPCYLYLNYPPSTIMQTYYRSVFSQNMNTVSSLEYGGSVLNISFLMGAIVTWDLEALWSHSFCSNYVHHLGLLLNSCWPSASLWTISSAFLALIVMSWFKLSIAPKNPLQKLLWKVRRQPIKGKRHSNFV